MEENPNINNMYKRWKDVKEYSDSRIRFQSLMDKKDGLDLITDVSTVISSVLVNHEERLRHKQDTLTAGENITIVGNVISSTGSGHIYDPNKDSLAEGLKESAGELNQALGKRSHAEGEGVIAFGKCSHAEGRFTEASGDYAHVEGEGDSYYTEKDVLVRKLTNEEIETIKKEQALSFEPNYFIYNFSPDCNFRFIYKNTTYSCLKSKFVWEQFLSYLPYGLYCEIDGDIDIPEEEHNNEITIPLIYAFYGGAFGHSSHAEGGWTEASGDYSHAEGCWTEASGEYSHAEGDGTKAIGNGSHAEGGFTEASGEYSHAEGRYNKSNSIEIPQSIEYVDLGLPSGLLWAKCNLGATSETEYGNYYAWGEVETKETYTGANYKWTEDGLATVTKYNLTDNKTKLDVEDDAAAYNIGMGWRMPTCADFTELLNYTSSQVVADYQGSGVSGGLFTGPNGNTLFMPCSGYKDYSSLINANSRGYIWSSTRYSDARFAYYLDIYSVNIQPSQYIRGYGFTVRPVISPSDWPKVNTIHSTGIGTSDNDRKNAFEIMDNGDVYVKGVGGYDGANPGTADTLQETVNNVQVKEVDYTSGSTASVSIEPNKMYMFGEKTNLTITGLVQGTTGIVNEYMFQFSSGNTATTLNVPNTVNWLNNPNIQTNKIYQVSIENNLGIIGEWSNE